MPSDPRRLLEDRALLDRYGFDEAEIAARRRYFDFGPDDEERLVAVKERSEAWMDGVIDDLYAHLLAFDQTRAFFGDPRTLEHVRTMQRRYFLQLTGGAYGLDYFADRLRVGATHQRIGLSIKWYLGAYAVYLRSFARRVFAGPADERAGALETFLAAMKLVLLDVSVAIDTYEHLIARQRAEIARLSTPVLRLKAGLLLVPVVGVLDDRRAATLSETLLEAIRAHTARVVLLDITGVAEVDARVPANLVQVAEAARLMGCTTIITGVRPDVARALVELGPAHQALRTGGDLQAGMAEAERLLSQGRSSDPR